METYYEVYDQGMIERYYDRNPALDRAAELALEHLRPAFQEDAAQDVKDAARYRFGRVKVYEVKIFHVFGWKCERVREIKF